MLVTKILDAVAVLALAGGLALIVAVHVVALAALALHVAARPRREVRR